MPRNYRLSHHDPDGTEVYALEEAGMQEAKVGTKVYRFSSGKIVDGLIYEMPGEGGVVARTPHAQVVWSDGERSPMMLDNKGQVLSLEDVIHNAITVAVDAKQKTEAAAKEASRAYDALIAYARQRGFGQSSTVYPKTVTETAEDFVQQIERDADRGH